MTRLAVFSLLLILVGCSSPTPESAKGRDGGKGSGNQDAVSTTDPTAPTPVLPPVNVPVESIDAMLAKARAALTAKRSFAPAGDNAFEWYLLVFQKESDNSLAKNGLSDLFPYAVLHVEQLLGSQSHDEAARVLDLMTKANSQAPALPRLREELNQGRKAAEEAEQRAQEAEEERARAEEEKARQEELLRLTPAPAPQENKPTTIPSPPPVEPVTSQPAPRPSPPQETKPVPAKFPKAIVAPSPGYPPAAMRRHLEGSVEVGFTVLEDGSVTDIKVLSRTSVFDKEAVATIGRWKFEAQPGRKPMTGRQVFDFALKR